MINAVIFDMDGVISDTQKLHSGVESELLRKCGIDIAPEEITRKYSGVRTADFFNSLLGGRYDVDALMKEKWEKMSDLAEKEVEPIDGAQKLIADLYEHDFKLAVASASRLKYVNAVLSKLGVREKFQAIVSSEEVRRGKPDPDVFLLAAERMSMAPKETLVIEDGISGMIASRRAGMKCIGLVPDKSSQTYPADILVTSLTELSPECIRRL